jgi:hypothetical protein
MAAAFFVKLRGRSRSMSDMRIHHASVNLLRPEHMPSLHGHR